MLELWPIDDETFNYKGKEYRYDEVAAATVEYAANWSGKQVANSQETHEMGLRSEVLIWGNLKDADFKNIEPFGIRDSINIFNHGSKGDPKVSVWLTSKDCRSMGLKPQYSTRLKGKGGVWLDNPRCKKNGSALLTLHYAHYPDILYDGRDDSLIFMEVKSGNRKYSCRQVLMCAAEKYKAMPFKLKRAWVEKGLVDGSRGLHSILCWVDFEYGKKPVEFGRFSIFEILEMELIENWNGDLCYTISE
jgi:hypothetical protein